MDGYMTCDFTFFSKVCQSYKDEWDGDNERQCAMEPDSMRSCANMVSTISCFDSIQG